MTRRIFASDFVDPFGDAHEEELQAAGQSFRRFLMHWHFVNRETGTVQAFTELWKGQERFVEVMNEHRLILALKAGKLGFTELECAYDAWVALFGAPNARVHVFSKDERAAVELIERIRDGLRRLPSWMRLPVAKERSGAESRTMIRLRAGGDDVRTIVSYPASTTAAIDQTATHSHVDELAHMLHPEETWNSIQTTIAPGGSCHVVTRGAGDDNYVAALWSAAVTGTTEFFPFFQPWNARPDRTSGWREQQAMTLSMEGLLHFAPETAEDALAGAETAEFLSAASWDRCYDETLVPLESGDRTALVLGIDAAVVGDCFAIVAVSRHPQRHDEAAIRACKLWSPAEHGGRVDYDEIERWLLLIIKGGCAQGHPKLARDLNCDWCKRGDVSIQPFNVVEIVFDPYQMEQMSQRLDRLVWMNPFPQGQQRLIADSMFHKLVLRHQLSHSGDPRMREHLLNVRAKLSKDEDSQLRMIKKAPDRKIDLAVAASMATYEALRLNI